MEETVSEGKRKGGARDGEFPHCNTEEHEKEEEEEEREVK